MIDAALIHTCSILRYSDSIASQELQFGALATVLTAVPCLIQPTTDATSVSPMGIGQREWFSGILPANTDIRENDILSWDQEAIQLHVREVRKLQEAWLHGSGLESHIEVELQLREQV
ncbi:MAG: hypothetical protein ACE5FA_00030 [Dehalococcoidia bacterium]